MYMEGTTHCKAMAGSYAIKRMGAIHYSSQMLWSRKWQNYTKQIHHPNLYDLTAKNAHDIRYGRSIWAHGCRCTSESACCRSDEDANIDCDESGFHGYVMVEKNGGIVIFFWWVRASIAQLPAVLLINIADHNHPRNIAMSIFNSQFSLQSSCPWR